MDPINEDELIALIRSAAGAGEPPPLLGIGDDAAILALGGAGLVCTVDDHREGTHFRRRWCPPLAIGRRAAGAALSDLAAMGARGRGVLLALQLPPNFERPALRALIEGFQETARAAGAPLVGGNLCAADVLNLSVTALGEVDPARALRRDAARPGDGLWISGGLGGAALALEALEARDGEAEAGDDVDPALASLIKRYLDPIPRLDLGQALVDLAADRPLAAMDISDGLARDAARLARASKLALRIEAGAALHPDAAAVAARRGRDGPRLAWSSGEEYQLLVAAPPSLDRELEALGLTRIGEARGGPAGVVEDGEGRVVSAGLGFDHFS